MLAPFTSPQPLMIRLLSLLLGVLPVLGQDAQRAPVEPNSLPAPNQTMAPVQPALTKLDDGRMQIGKVVFDPKAREIHFPATVNQTEGLLEFVVVHQNGKIHESLLLTDISATNLNLAFKLLGFKPSPELYSKIEEDGSHSSEFEDATEAQKKASRVNLLIETEAEGKTVRHPISRWISHGDTEKDMPASPWIYGGSFIHRGKFVAETSGDIIAIFLSNAALINFSGKDNDLDEVWLPHPRRVPPEGTPVNVVIKPF